jgi:glycine oxidase
MLSVETVPALIHHCVYRDEVYLVPRPSGELLIGATVERVGYDKHVTPEGLHWLLSEALAAVPALAQRPIVRSWAGIRPVSPDGLPIIGAWPGLDRCFVATGHFRNGILLAPITAKLLRELIVDGAPSLSLAPFRPDRFLT